MSTGSGRRNAIALILREAGHDPFFSVAEYPRDEGNAFEVIDGDANGVLITNNERLARELSELFNDIA